MSSSQVTAGSDSMPKRWTSRKKLLPKHARSHNRGLVLETLYRDGQQSRADIARATKLSRVTVSELVAQLIDEGLIVELGLRGGSRPGKPATLLDVDKHAFTIVGIDLSQPSLFRGALLDLDGAIIERAELSSQDAQGDDALDSVAAFIAELMERSSSPILGVGIGSPGIIDDAGVVIAATNLGWFHKDLAGFISQRFSIPAVVTNDADAAAVAESVWGNAADDVIVVRVGRGVGAGVIVNGQLVRGGKFTAGEIGHVVVDVEGGAPCTCGKTGCLETWLSVSSVRRRLENVESEGQAAAVQMAAGQRLGSVLSPVIAMLNIAEVILSGPDEVFTDRVIQVTTETIARRIMLSEKLHVDVRRSTLADEGVLRGVAARVRATELGIN